MNLPFESSATRNSIGWLTSGPECFFFSRYSGVQ